MPAEEFIGKTIADIFGEESYEKLNPFGDRALEGESIEWEGWLHHPRLGDRYVMRVYRPYARPDGTIDGYFVLVRDRTDERLRQEALDRERCRLLAAVARGLRRLRGAPGWCRCAAAPPSGRSN